MIVQISMLPHRLEGKIVLAVVGDQEEYYELMEYHPSVFSLVPHSGFVSFFNMVPSENGEGRQFMGPIESPESTNVRSSAYDKDSDQ